MANWTEVAALDHIRVQFSVAACKIRRKKEADSSIGGGSYFPSVFMRVRHELFNVFDLWNKE